MSKRLQALASQRRALDAIYDARTVDRMVAEVDTAVLAGVGAVTFPRRGRPSLSGQPAPSPTLGFRVSPELKDSAEELAQQEGVTVSELARHALEVYIRKAG